MFRVQGGKPLCHGVRLGLRNLRLVYSGGALAREAKSRVLGPGVAMAACGSTMSRRKLNVYKCPAAGTPSHTSPKYMRLVAAALWAAAIARATAQPAGYAFFRLRLLWTQVFRARFQVGVDTSVSCSANRGAARPFRRDVRNSISRRTCICYRSSHIFSRT